MLDYSGKDEHAKLVALHYAKELADVNLIEVINAERGVANKNEAIALAEFFWEMLDRSVLDYENGIAVEGEVGVQFWIERLMNIYSGYLYSAGYSEQWEDVSDKA